jgi:hypothetical protein
MGTDTIFILPNDNGSYLNGVYPYFYACVC